MKCGKCDKTMFKTKYILYESMENPGTGQYIYPYYCLDCGNCVETCVDDLDSPWVPWNKYRNFKKFYLGESFTNKNDKLLNTRRELINAVTKALCDAEEKDMFNIYKRLGNSNASNLLGRIVSESVNSASKNEGAVTDELRRLSKKQLYLSDLDDIDSKYWCDEVDKKFEDNISYIQSQISIGFYGGYNIHMEAKTFDGNTYKIKCDKVLPLGGKYQFVDVKQYIQSGSLKYIFYRNNELEIPRVTSLTWQWDEKNHDLSSLLLDTEKFGDKEQKLLSDMYVKEKGCFVVINYKNQK